MMKQITSLYQGDGQTTKTPRYDRIYFYYDVDGINKEVTIPIIPTSIDYSYNPNFTSQQTIGRLSPIYKYISGGDEIYSFAVSIHQDMLTNKKLTDLVDDIKRLSYPIYRGGIQTYPRIHFILGEIEADVIVDTSVAWKKPIIDGHYAVVELGFAIRVVRTYKLFNVRHKEQDQSIDLEAHDDRIYSWYDDETWSEIKEHLQGRYNTSVQDLVIESGDEAYQSLMYNKTIKTYDAQLERLSTLYNALEVIDWGDNTGMKSTTQEYTANMRAISNLFSTYGQLESRESDITKVFQVIWDNIRWGELEDSEQQLKRAIKNAEKYTKRYFNEYLDAPGVDITSKEKNKIVSEIIDIYKNLYELTGEVAGYAAST